MSSSRFKCRNLDRHQRSGPARGGQDEGEAGQYGEIPRGGPPLRPAAPDGPGTFPGDKGEGRNRAGPDGVRESRKQRCKTTKQQGRLPGSGTPGRTGRYGAFMDDQEAEQPSEYTKHSRPPGSDPGGDHDHRK
jgi:hypothetical protein